MCKIYFKWNIFIWWISYQCDQAIMKKVNILEIIIIAIKPVLGLNSIVSIAWKTVSKLILQTMELKKLPRIHCKETRRDFPGGPVVKNLLSNAGHAGSIPGRGTKIPRAAAQLSPRATTTEPASLNERANVLQTTEPTCSGTCVPQLWSPRALEPVLH